MLQWTYWAFIFYMSSQFRQLSGHFGLPGHYIVAGQQRILIISSVLDWCLLGFDCIFYAPLRHLWLLHFLQYTCFSHSCLSVTCCISFGNCDILLVLISLLKFHEKCLLGWCLLHQIIPFADKSYT